MNLAHWILAGSLVSSAGSFAPPRAADLVPATAEAFELGVRWCGPHFLPCRATPAGAPPAGALDGAGAAFNAGTYNINGPGFVAVNARGTSILVAHLGPDPLIASSHAVGQSNFLVLLKPATKAMPLTASPTVVLRTGGNASGSYSFLP